jgi:hypothetical protein
LTAAFFCNHQLSDTSTANFETTTALLILPQHFWIFPPPNLSLALITLTVCVTYTAVFEYQKQGIFNMAIFEGGPSLPHWHLLLVSKRKRHF